MEIAPVTLQGRHVRLEPLLESHHAALCEVGLDAEIWTYYPEQILTPDEMRASIREMLAGESAGTTLPFVTVERSSGKVVGGTRFMNIDVPNKRLEIGGTWLAAPWRRTAINTEAKYLMMRHAFEVFGCNRVEWKTDALNQRSRAAILRLGAKEEGTLRRHMVTWSGRLRDSVYFSVLNTEWPEVKLKLEEKLEK